jgi:hypothetical protein
MSNYYGKRIIHVSQISLHKVRKYWKTYLGCVEHSGYDGKIIQKWAPKEVNSQLVVYSV